MRDYNLEQAVEWLSADPSRVDALAADKSLNGKHAAAVVRWALVRMQANRMEREATRGEWSPSGALLRQGIRRALGIDDGVSVDDAGLIADVEERIRQAGLCHNEHAIARPAVARTDGQPPAGEPRSSRWLVKDGPDSILGSFATRSAAEEAQERVRPAYPTAWVEEYSARSAAPADDTAACPNESDIRTSAGDTAAPDGPPTTITVTLPAAEHDIDGEDAHGRWTQNPAWETRGIEFGVISAWAQGVCIEDVLHDEGDVIELEETARKVLAAVEQHRHLARRLAAEGSDS